MRTSITTLAAVLTLAAGSAFAQPAPSTPVRTEGPFSPFTYEALGATPSIRLHKATAPAEAKAPVKENTAAAGTQEKGKPATGNADAPAAQATAPARSTTH